MLTIEVKVNGRVIAKARAANISGLADVSEYLVDWSELGEPDLGLRYDDGDLRIADHRRRQTAWALVAKIAAAILGQKVERMEGKG